jgi:hypothetical protein
MVRNEVILLFEIGFKDLVHAISTKGKRITAFIIDEIVID